LSSPRRNRRPFRNRREESRASLFRKLDQSALQPLPTQRYDLSQWMQARVNSDYHVAFDDNWYSVPYTLTSEAVEDARHGRDLSPRQARGFASPLARAQ
jgi:hypothetical protein